MDMSEDYGEPYH